MVKYTIFAGGFGTFIASYLFDSNAGTLSLLSQTKTGNNPSWITQHPTNTSVLYTVNENNPGNLQSYLIKSGGGLMLVDTIASDGSSPTHSAFLSTGEVTAINYGSPLVKFVKTNAKDPARFVPSSNSTISFPIPSGGRSNPHQSVEYKGEVFIPDLGADKIWRVTRNTTGIFKVQGQIDVTAGSGPRHIAIRNDILFTLNELNSQLTARTIPSLSSTTKSTVLSTISVTPPSPPTGAKFAAAEVLISPPTTAFPSALIYASNRNTASAAGALDPRGDAIAIIEYDEAAQRLKLVAHVYTGLNNIRGMAIGKVADGGDEFLVVAANSAGGVKVFRRTEKGRALVEVAKNANVAGRSSFVFA